MGGVSLCKHKDVNLDPQHACTKTSMPVSPVLGEGVEVGVGMVGADTEESMRLTVQLV